MPELKYQELTLNLQWISTLKPDQCVKFEISYSLRFLFPLICTQFSSQFGLRSMPSHQVTCHSTFISIWIARLCSRIRFILIAQLTVSRTPLNFSTDALSARIDQIHTFNIDHFTGVSLVGCVPDSGEEENILRFSMLHVFFECSGAIAVGLVCDCACNIFVFEVVLCISKTTTKNNGCKKNNKYKPPCGKNCE